MLVLIKFCSLIINRPFFFVAGSLLLVNLFFLMLIYFLVILTHLLKSKQKYVSMEYTVNFRNKRT